MRPSPVPPLLPPLPPSYYSSSSTYALTWRLFLCRSPHFRRSYPPPKLDKYGTDTYAPAYQLQYPKDGGYAPQPHSAHGAYEQIQAPKHDQYSYDYSPGKQYPDPDPYYPATDKQYSDKDGYYKPDYTHDRKPAYKPEYKPDLKPDYSSDYQLGHAPDHKPDYTPVYKPDYKPD